jgi:hypothetical protein
LRKFAASENRSAELRQSAHLLEPAVLKQHVEFLKVLRPQEVVRHLASASAFD